MRKFEIGKVYKISGDKDMKIEITNRSAYNIQFTRDGSKMIYNHNLAQYEFFPDSENTEYVDLWITKDKAVRVKAVNEIAQ